ncbi:unnamed protein product [Caretta caretta]
MSTSLEGERKSPGPLHCAFNLPGIVQPSLLLSAPLTVLLETRPPAAVADSSKHKWPRRKCQECQAKKSTEDKSLKMEEKARDSGRSNLSVSGLRQLEAQVAKKEVSGMSSKEEYRGQVTEDGGEGKGLWAQ